MLAEHYRNSILKHWLLILMCSVLTGVAVGLGSYLIAPTYQSTATVQLVTFSTSPAAITAANQLLQTEANLATSASIVGQVARHYPGLTTAQLQAETSAPVVASTQLIQITVTDHSATRAAQLANALAAALVAQQKQTTQQFDTQSQQPLLANLAATQKQIDTDQATITTLQTNPAANAQQIQQLQGDVTNLQQRYDQELQALTALQNNEATTASYLQIVGVAQPSSKPVHSTSWHAAIAAAGLGLGVLLGILLVLLRDRLDQQLLTAPELSEVLGWPILEELELPAANSATSVSAADGVEQEEAQQETPYQMLDQKLDFFEMEAPLFSLAVTGMPADSTAANVVAGGLAWSLAKRGKRVVVVDANFSRPSQHRRFGTPAEPGLGAAILAFNAASPAEQSLEPYLYPAGDDAASLRVLPAGPIPPNPRQVLKSRAMQSVFQALRKTEADAVVLAAPPVTGSSDACVLPALADGAIVVIGRSHARKVQLLRMKQSLTEAGVRILGCVVWSSASTQARALEQPDKVAGARLP